MLGSFVDGSVPRDIAVGIVVIVIGAIGGVLLRRVLNIWVRLRSKRILVYVSTGGTCRDPMAKVITEQLIKGRKPTIYVYAAAILPVRSYRASKAAQFVVKEVYGEGLLRRHMPQQLTQELAERARLILTMEEAHVEILTKRFPEYAGKIKALKPFFGMSGDVKNPYRAPNEMDAKTIERYRSTFSELREIISDNIDRLYEALS